MELMGYGAKARLRGSKLVSVVFVFISRRGSGVENIVKLRVVDMELVRTDSDYWT